MTDITIAAGSFPHYEGPDDPEIWIIANKPYVTPDGKCVTANSLLERTFVARGVCSVDEDRLLTTPELVVDATEDAIANSDATLGAYLVTSQGRPISVLSVFKSFRVPASPSETSWDLLAGLTPPDPGDLPDVPATPTASEFSSAQVNFSFTSSTGSTSYKVKRSENGGPFTTLSGSWSPGSNADTTVVAGRTYAYKVAGHNAAGDSAYSAASNTVTAEDPPPTPAYALVQDGNGRSVSNPYGTVIAGQSYADRLQNYLDLAGADYSWVNLSVGGRTTQTMSTDEANIDSHVVGEDSIYLPFDCDDNDITEQNKTSTQALSYLQTMVDNEVAAPYKVLLNTPPDRTEYSNPTKSGYRDDVIAAIRAGITGAVGFVDFAAIPELANCNDLRFFYYDKVHFTEAIYQILAQEVGVGVLAQNPALTHVISGTVTSGGVGQAGVVITLRSDTFPLFCLRTVTDSLGHYVLPPIGDSAYKLHAFKVGFAYDPYTIASLTANQTKNFTATTTAAEEDVVWTEVTGVTVGGDNALTKTAGDGDGNGGACSEQTFVGEGRFRITITEQRTRNDELAEVIQRIVGLTTGTSHNYTGMDFGLFLRSDNTLQFIVGGAVYGSTTVAFSYGVVDVFDVEIRIIAGTRYACCYRNGLYLFSTTLTLDAIYRVDTDVYYSGKKCENIRIARTAYTISGTITLDGSPLADVLVALSGDSSGSSTTDASGNYLLTAAAGGDVIVTPTLDGYDFTPSLQSYTALAANQTRNFTAAAAAPPADVTWQNMVGVSETAHVLTKTGSAGYNSGASSVETITGTGEARFTLPNVTSDYVFGLNDTDANQNYPEIDFGFYCQVGSVARVIESGGFPSGTSNFAITTSDTLKTRIVDVGGGTRAVQYWKNTTLIYTSLLTVPSSLRVDTAFNTAGMTFGPVLTLGFS